MARTRVFAVGHSTRAIEDFVRALERQGVATLADVRTIPRSRHNPQFDRSALPRSLAREGIGYVHLPRLGGLRHSRGDDPATAAWHNESFRAYADYMQTDEFEDALDELLSLQMPVAIMCAEALPWRCHRSLICDGLLARGIVAQHLIGDAEPRPHHLTSFARLARGHVSYPAPA